MKNCIGIKDVRILAWVTSVTHLHSYLPCSMSYPVVFYLSAACSTVTIHQPFAFFVFTFSLAASLFLVLFLFLVISRYFDTSDFQLLPLLGEPIGSLLTVLLFFNSLSLSPSLFFSLRSFPRVHRCTGWLIVYRYADHPALAASMHVERSQAHALHIYKGVKHQYSIRSFVLHRNKCGRARVPWCSMKHPELHWKALHWKILQVKEADGVLEEHRMKVKLRCSFQELPIQPVNVLAIPAYDD